MQPIFKEYNVVLENSKLLEELGIEKLMFAKVTIDLTQVVVFRESLDANGDIEPYTIVYTEQGTSFCIDISYEDFQIMFHTEIIPVINEQRRVYAKMVLGTKGEEGDLDKEEGEGSSNSDPASF